MILNQNMVAIHQPNFLPWLGYFHKMNLADTFIVHDDVQLNWRGYTRRVPIRSSLDTNELTWIYAPIPGILKDHNIHEIQLPNTQTAWQKILTQIHSIYAKAPFFEQVFPILERFNCPNQISLKEFNMSLINLIGNKLGINTLQLISSDYSVAGKGTDKLIGLIKASGHRRYLSGIGGRNYQDEKVFEASGIELMYVDGPATIESLTQEFSGAIAEASVIDWLCMFGWEAVENILHKRLNKEYVVTYK